MSRRNMKLDRVVHALGEISLLDQRSDATVIDAVRLAEQALRDIERDSLHITLRRTRKGGLAVHISSAAGNESIVREVLPHVQALLDGIAVELGGKPIKWGKIKRSHLGRNLDDKDAPDA